MTVGQSVTVNISSPNSGVFYVSTNSNSDSVTANINGSSAILTGVSVGGANINICQQGYGCGNLYGYVAPTAGGPNSVSASTAASANANPPALASFSVTSNNVNNNFTGSGVALTFSFQFNQGVINPQVKVNGNQALVNGSGNGPYQSIYTMTGSEASPLPISITFANANGATGQAYFTVGGLSSVQSTSAVTTVCPSGMTCTPSSLTAVNGFYSFTRYLYMGMTKLGVSDPDVLALQNRLKSDGIYSGPITGYFGSQTKTAVETYQKKNDLSPLGVIGPGTRNLLNKGI
jgi:hypothetical protein